MGKQLYGLSVSEKLKQLIAIPSTTPPGEVREMVDSLCLFAKETGAQTALQEVEPKKHNCIITYSFGAGRTLVMNTHMDVNNPAGQLWKFDPFCPFERDGKLFGLGACDAKGSMAAMLTAFERLVRHPQGLAGTLLFTAVMGEEAGGIGSLHMVKQGIAADAAVVGEPTELKVCTAHKGTYMRRIIFRGRAAHSASSHLGINAIDHAAAFCALYNRLGEQLFHCPHEVLGAANASVTLIKGGTRQNTIPEACELVIDRRLLPGESHQKADAELQEILQELQRQKPEAHVEKIEVIVSTVPSETESGEKIVETALHAAAAITGRDYPASGFQAGCDMSKLVNIAGIPTVILGPGSLRNAHAPDEFVEILQLEQAVDIYEAIIREILKGD